MGQDHTTRELPVGDLLRRVFVAVAEPELREDLQERLQQNGFLVRAVDSIEGLHDQVLDFHPELLVLGETFPQGSGRQALLKLRASGSTFAVPAVAVLKDGSISALFRWLKMGVVDLWPYPWKGDPAAQAKLLLNELAQTLVQTAEPRVRLLAWARRTQLDGTVVVFPDTPFEARATFLHGELAEARSGALQGTAAVEHLLELDEVPVRWFDGADTQPMNRPLSLGAPRANVLVVEDEDSVRALVAKRLRGAGYRVETASDGAAGLQKALRTPYDLIVVDLSLPRLDGWGLLRQLREDVVARESSVLVLSAQDDEVDTLKAARAGARAYLKKSGHASELLTAVGLLAGARAQAWSHLEARHETKVELRTVGAVWLVRALAELDCAGRLEVEDELGRYELTVGQGLFLEAVAQTGSLRVTGPVAVEAVLSSRGEARFVFAAVKLPEEAPWLFDVVDVVCDGLRKDQARRLANALGDPGRLYFNEELAQLFTTRATAAELQVLEELRQSPASFESLKDAVGLPAEDVTEALAELLRRGVISVDP